MNDELGITNDELMKLIAEIEREKRLIEGVE